MLCPLFSGKRIRTNQPTRRNARVIRFVLIMPLGHTFASIAITNGADVASVSEKLGHSDKAVTLRMYTHADHESIKRAGDIFREALKAGQE